MLAAAVAGDASARQAGYAYLQCDTRWDDGRADRIVYRIGAGQWDYLSEGYWRPIEDVACGAERTASWGRSSRQCGFAEHEYTTRIDSTSSHDVSSATFTINRFTGRYEWRYQSSSGGSRSSEGECRTTPAPPTVERRL